MEDWKLPELRAHVQMEVGRIDSLRWCLDRLDLFQDEDNAESKQDVEDRIRDLKGTVNLCEGYINKILEARESKKQQRLDELKATHEQFKPSY